MRQTARRIVDSPEFEKRKISIGSGNASSKPLEFRVSNCPVETNREAPGPILSPINGLSKSQSDESRNIDVARIEK